MSIQDQISALLGDHNAEHKRLVEYVVEQLGHGRSLADVIDDPYVTNRLSAVERPWDRRRLPAAAVSE